MTSPPTSARLDLSRELHRQAQRLGSKPFLQLPEGSLSWSDVDDLVGRVASGLVERGHGPGAVLMTAGGSASTQLAVWFAAQRIGAIWAPLNPLLSGRPLTQIVSQARPDLVVVDSGSPAEVTSSPLTLIDIHDLLGHDVLGPPAQEPDPARRAKLMFTSGTTGEPKGVVWSRRCEAVWAEAYGRELLDVDEGAGLFTCLPLSHVTGQGTVMAALQRGAVLTLADGFSPFRFWDQVGTSGAERITFVGTILSTLLKRRPGPEDRAHNLDRIVGAGAPIARWREIEDRFGVEIMETWGQTESAGCYTRPERLPQRPGSIGTPTDRFEIRLDDSVGGEMLIRPTDRGAIFDGYLRADRTLESPYDEDGWYHTGDVVRLADDGELEFVVRHRESIRRRGEIIASVPIEEAALAHPGVAEAAAVGVQAADGADQEIKLSFIALETPKPVEPAELHRFLRDRLPSFMVPRYLEAVTALPKTPSTRIQKFKLNATVDGAWDARRRRAHPSR